MIRKLDHVNLVVADRDRSKDFYLRAFGFQVNREFESDEPTLSAISGQDGTRVRVALIELGEATLGLVELVGKASPPAAKALAVGSPTLVFETDDLDDDYRRLQDMGVRFKSQPQVEEKFGVEVVQGLDPDGVTFQLVQRR